MTIVKDGKWRKMSIWQGERQGVWSRCEEVFVVRMAGGWQVEVKEGGKGG